MVACVAVVPVVALAEGRRRLDGVPVPCEQHVSVSPAQLSIIGPKLS